MVAIGKSELLLCSFYCFVSLISCNSLLSVPLESNVCKETCEKTYPSHTYEKSFSRECCERGCRLYSIIEFVGDEDGLEGTLKSCHNNCMDAYPSNKDKSDACILGCNSQKPVTDIGQNLLSPGMSVDGGSLTNMMYPFLYMHSVYSNMVEKARHHVSVSWSFFMQDGTGRLVVVKSQPSLVNVDQADFDDYYSYRGTSASQETNIEASDNTATQVLRHSQINAARSLGDAMVPHSAHLHTSDWLSCISHKTGIPRVLLCVLILLSAVAMIWLCMSAAVTSPDHKIPEKLGVVKFDLDYLKNLEKHGIKGIHPQDIIEAHPLPAKLRIEQI